jgi:tetratricopeptide (TPR) repeat protein
MNLATIGLAAILAAAQAQPARDRVILHRGNPVEGTVQKDTWKEVVVQTAGGSQTFRPQDVRRIEYADAPLAFRGAIAQIEGEKWSEALSSLKSAEEYANRGLCELNLGRLDQAIPEFARIRKDFRDSRFLADAYTLALQAHREKGDEKGMEAVEKEIEQAPVELRTDLVNQARRQRAELLYDKNRYDEARKLFEALKSSADPETAAEATAGVIRCLRGLKDAQGLETFCNGVLTTATQPALLLIASNALGDLRFEKKQFAQARDFYVRSVVLHYPGRGGGLEREHEHALYRLARCYEELLEAAKDPKAREFLAQQASGAFREVSIEYPSGRYREEAVAKAAKYEPKDEKEAPRKQ